VVNKGKNGPDSKLEKLIQELEFKTLSYEITQQKLQDEIEIRKTYEKEVSGLNQTLQDQTVRLNELIRELKSYTYTVSHDLKSPLRGILGYSQELLKRHVEQLPARPLFCVQQIAIAAQNLEDLIEDLLQYSRLELEIPTCIEVNFRSLVEKLIRDRACVISEYKTKIDIQLDCETLWCWERGFTQTLSNLIDNAIKYSRKSQQPAVLISCTLEEDCYRLKIQDNGIGFDMEFNEKIFDLFHRLLPSTEYEGTGAGLAIVRKVMEKMDGKAWAESAPGEGATFFLELPLKNKDDSPMGKWSMKKE